MTWNCEQVEGSLSDYVDRLLGLEERGEFEAHVAGCARCAPLVKSISGLVTGLRQLEPLEVPPRLTYNILDRTLGPRAAKQGIWSWLAWLRPVWQPRVAYGAVSVLVTTFVLFHVLGGEWRRPKLADFNPVNIYRAADRRAHLIYARGAKFISDLRVVYEIQSRLRPEPEAQPAPEPKPSQGQPPGQSNGPQQKSPRELNRAHDKNQDYSVLACAFSTLPARNMQ